MERIVYFIAIPVIWLAFVYNIIVVIVSRFPRSEVLRYDRKGLVKAFIKISKYQFLLFRVHS